MTASNLAVNRGANGEYGSAGISTWMRWLSRASRFALGRGPGPIILMYHQIADLADDPWSLAVNPPNFAEHLQVLAAHWRPISLPGLTAELGGAALDPRQVAITFDDGYRDNLVNARPMLEKYAMPATVFVVSDAVGQQREFWWDTLDRLLLGRHPLPRTLRLRIAGRTRQWDLTAGARGESDRRTVSRERLHQQLWRKLREMPATERLEVIEALREWTGQPAVVRPDRQVLDEHELRALAEGGLIEIGAHTASHPRLSALPPDEQLADVLRGKERLEAIVGRPVTSFSYPFGGTLDVSVSSVETVRKAGFARACTTRRAAVRPTSDPFRLPRVYVGNWSGEEFERRMALWLAAR